MYWRNLIKLQVSTGYSTTYLLDGKHLAALEHDYYQRPNDVYLRLTIETFDGI